MIYLLQEKIFKNEELKNYDLRELRQEIRYLKSKLKGTIKWKKDI